jgi:hypothetical protein
MRNAAILFILIANSAFADAITIGPDGIDSEATGLDGDGIEIGQLEGGRSGKPGYGHSTRTVSLKHETETSLLPYIGRQSRRSC